MFSRSFKRKNLFLDFMFWPREIFLSFLMVWVVFLIFKKKTVIIILSMGENWKIMFNFIQAFLSSNV